MTNNRKSENGINYTIQRRRDPSLTEHTVYWLGDDGSILELTKDEIRARDSSSSITGKDRSFGDA